MEHRSLCGRFGEAAAMAYGGGFLRTRSVNVAEQSLFRAEPGSVDGYAREAAGRQGEAAPADWPRSP